MATALRLAQLKPDDVGAALRSKFEQRSTPGPGPRAVGRGRRGASAVAINEKRSKTLSAPPIGGATGWMDARRRWFPGRHFVVA